MLRQPKCAPAGPGAPMTMFLQWVLAAAGGYVPFDGQFFAVPLWVVQIVLDLARCFVDPSCGPAPPLEDLLATVRDLLHAGGVHAA